MEKIIYDIIVDLEYKSKALDDINIKLNRITGIDSDVQMIAKDQHLGELSLDREPTKQEFEEIKGFFKEAVGKGKFNEFKIIKAVLKRRK